MRKARRRWTRPVFYLCVAMVISAVLILVCVYYCIAPSGATYPARLTGGQSVVAVDTDYSGVWSSIALDPNKKVHISYQREGSTLGYATNAGGSWVCSTVDGTAQWGEYSSIAVDSDYNVHISYYEDENLGSPLGNLKYATSSGVSWTKSVIDSDGDVGMYTSIAIDLNNKVHISYYDYTNGALKYATNAGGSWTARTIDNDRAGYWGTSIAVDPSNSVHISYCHTAPLPTVDHDLMYATNASGLWATETVESAGDVGYYSSIAIDSSNGVHISYYDVANGNLKYAKKAGGPWTTETVAQAGVVGQYTSIAIDSSGKVHISYYDYSDADLNYATNVGGSWATYTLDYSTGDLGKYSSIAVDSDYNVHISYYAYYDTNNRYLKYVTFSGVPTPIPEFPGLLVPVLGSICLVVAVSAARRKRN